MSVAGSVGLGEEVEVADRLAPAAVRARRFDAPDARRRSERLDQARRSSCSARWRSIRSNRSSSLRDPLEDERLGPGGHPALLAEPARLGGLAEVVDRLDAEVLVELADGLGPEPRDAEQLDEARRHLGAQLVVEAHVARRRELGDLVADRLADALDPRRACPTR